jgi:gamma-tubulin complex component 3
MHTWHEIGIIMAAMNHFIRQLQSYCQLEVIECQWKALMDFAAKKVGDLDALIESHRSYLRHIVTKALLLHPKKEKEVRNVYWESLANC